MENGNEMNKSIDELKNYIGKEIRIKIKDNRIIEGEFQCIDRELNFIIGGAIEMHGLDDNDIESKPKVSKRLGMVLIPGNNIITCLIKK